MRFFNRTDPAGCGCTDCLTGYSVPVDDLTEAEIEYACCIADTPDASGLTEREWDELVGIDRR